MPTIREWRGTPEGRCALEMFPGRKVRELAAIVAGRRFRNETAALEFPTRICYWALLCLSEEGRFKSSRPKRPSSASRRDELLDISRLAGDIFCRANELRDRLRALPLQSRIEFGIASHPHDLTTFDGLLAATATRKFLDMDQSAKSAAEKISRGVRSGKPERALKRPLLQLAHIWKDATGHQPTVSISPTTRKRGGRFKKFAHAAIAPLWPGAGSIDGLLQEVCTEFRRCPRITCFL